MKLHEIMKNATDDVEIPWDVSRVLLGGKETIHTAGREISIGKGDFVNLADARNAVEWFVDQLGGKVKWAK